MFEFLLSMIPREAGWKGAILWWIGMTILIAAFALAFFSMFVGVGDFKHQVPGN